MFTLDCSIITTRRRTKKLYNAPKVQYMTPKMRQARFYAALQHVKKTFIKQKKKQRYKFLSTNLYFLED